MKPMVLPKKKTKQRPQGCEHLTNRQMDTVYGIQYSYYTEVGNYNMGICGQVTSQDYEYLSALYNGMINMVNENMIN